MLFFRTSAGRYGFAEHGRSGDWEFRLIDNPRDQSRVGQLFESFAKQIRTGWFELPNPLEPLAARSAQGAGL
jgi:hypothetical protein